MVKNLLAIGRAIGYESISEIQRLRKVLRSGKIGTYHTRFDINNGAVVDEFVSTATDTHKSVLKSSLSLLRELLPNSFSPKSNTSIDITVQRTGTPEFPGTTFITALAKSHIKPRQHIINSGSMHVARNQAGTILDLSLKGEARSSVNLETYIINGEKKNFDEKILANSINYYADRTRGKMIVHMPKNGNIKFLDSTIEGPKDLFDTLTNIFTHGLVGSFSNFLNGLKVK